MDRRRIIIMGAGGRDFHNFNTVYRDDPSREVAAFTAAQIPFLEGHRYPPHLSGPHYPDGIPIHAEASLDELITRYGANEVNFAYSDVSHDDVMHAASRCLALGADFVLLGPGRTMLRSAVPVISVCAVRTGCGKSIITRRVARTIMAKGLRPVVVRHPMAYGNFSPWTKFSSTADIDAAGCTIEEREEFEHHVLRGITVYAGVDYQQVLQHAEADAEVLIWDGGNNDFPFLAPNLEIVLVDALRPGQETRFHPGEVNLKRADVVIITKTNEASGEALRTIKGTVARENPGAVILTAPSQITCSDSEALRGRKALVVEDGPTITHGGMAFGAGVAGTASIISSFIDPRPYAVGSIRETYDKFPHIGPVLPAMGYSALQVKELEETIARVPAEVVVIATPVDLTRILHIDKATVRVEYDFAVDLDEVITRFVESHVR